MMTTFADPTEAWLEVSPRLREMAWQQSQSHATPASRWNAYLNCLCLNTVLPWIKAEYAPAASVWMSQADLPSIWEVVSGVALIVDNKRVVLLPSEAIDDGELEVPQEWVDSPTWAADYYLAVQIQLDEQADSHWVRLWGYTTHQDLKTSGRYDADDRTYSLSSQELIRDLSALWVTLQFCPDAQTQAAVAPLAELSATQVENLTQRLSSAPFPRLAVPFATWGALLAQNRWRQQLYQQRLQTQPNRLTRLSQWLRQQVEAGWQSVEELFGEDARFAANLRSATGAGGTITQGKRLALSNEQSVLLLVRLTREADDRTAITVQLHPDRSTALPAELTLALLTDTGEQLQSVQSTAQDGYIQLRRFRCPTGTQFSVQVQMGENLITEAFVV